MINKRCLSPTIKRSTSSIKGDQTVGNAIRPCSLLLEVEIPQHQEGRAEHNKHRRVQFSNDENNAQSAPHKELSSEMVEDIWYSSEEIQNFKEEVRSMVLQHYYKQGETKNENDEMAGLEKYDPRRSRFKQSALYYTLRAQRQSRDPKFLRSVARRCTAWARALATSQGFHDHCAVYDPLDGLLDVADFESRAVNVKNDEQSRILEIESTEKYCQYNETEMKPSQTKKQRLSYKY